MRYDRLKIRYGRFIFASLLVVFLLLLLLLGISYFLGQPPSMLHHDTFVIAGSPTLVVSWQGENKKLVMVKIPESIVIDGIHGYGRYSLRALWDLGTIEKKDGGVLAQSLEDALSIPIPWYISGSRDTTSDDAGETVRNIFSLGGMTRFVTGVYSTNMPLPLTFRLWWTIATIRSDRFKLIPLGDRATQKEVQPDGSVVSILFKESLDRIFGDTFEDRVIRREGMRVAVYNATQTPGLAERVAGVVGRLGAIVVRTGNGEVPVDRCQIQGQRRAIESYTARIIASLYTCDRMQTDEETEVDMRITVGKKFEKRYLPH